MINRSSARQQIMKSPKKRKPKLGSGARFKALPTKLKKRGAKNPKALAASIGRKKYGKKKMAAMAKKRQKEEIIMDKKTVAVVEQPTKVEVVPAQEDSMLGISIAIIGVIAIGAWYFYRKYTKGK